MLVLVADLLTTMATLLKPGGMRTAVADSLLMKQQLLVISRTRQRAPNLSTTEPSEPPSIKMWSGVSSPHIAGRVLVMMGPHG
jgi:hypothetical protein